jgi:hypothetical protein
MVSIAAHEERRKVLLDDESDSCRCLQQSWCNFLDVVSDKVASIGH